MRHRVVPPSWVFGCLSVWRRVQVMPGHPLPFIQVADFGLSKHDASLTFTRVVRNHDGLVHWPFVCIAIRPNDAT
jgi:hypothetical protein